MRPTTMDQSSMKVPVSGRPSVVLILILVAVGGTHIDFTGTPDVLTDVMTQTLALRCSLHDRTLSPTTQSRLTTTAGTGLVGRSIPEHTTVHDVIGTEERNVEISNVGEGRVDDDPPSTKGSTLDKNEDDSGNRLKRSNDENIRQVISITISRNKQLVATITPYTAAQLEDGGDGTKVQVTGDVVSGSGAEELGFLALEWQFPTKKLSGEYVCNIRAVTDAGHNADFTGTVDVKTSTITLDDMIQEMNDMKKAMFDQAVAITKLQAENSLHNRTIAIQQSIINKLTHDVVSALPHVETGTLSCGDVSDWNDGGVYLTELRRLYNYSKQISHTFSRPYTKAPVVFLSNAYTYILDNGSGNKWDKHGTGVVDVRTTGFTMACGSDTKLTSNTRYTYIGGLDVTWMSISN